MVLGSESHLDRPVPSSSTPPTETYVDSIVGAAIFDPNGLPREYFTTTENNDISWVQTAFQALGLRSLLVSSLQLEGFDHAITHSNGYFAIVVGQRTNYLALLIRQNQFKGVSKSFIRWAHELDINRLKSDPRFKSL